MGFALVGGTGGKESVQMRLALENSKIEMKGIGRMWGWTRRESWLSRE